MDTILYNCGFNIRLALCVLEFYESASVDIGTAMSSSLVRRLYLQPTAVPSLYVSVDKVVLRTYLLLFVHVQ